MNKLERYEGALLGHVNGDSLGAPFEIKNATQIFSELQKIGGLKHIPYQRAIDGVLRKTLSDLSPEQINNLPPGFWTDDTAEMLCLAETIISERGFSEEEFFLNLQHWLKDGKFNPKGFEHIYMGTGPNTTKILSNNIRDLTTLDGCNDKETSNGALMRTLPIALAYHGDQQKTEGLSQRAAYLTHNNRIVAGACVVFNTAVSCVLDGTHKDEIRQEVLNKLGNWIPSEVLNLLDVLERPQDFSESIKPQWDAVTTLKNAFWAFALSSNFAESIEKAVKIGGDTDTYAALTGGISGAYYGVRDIPSSWLDETMDISMFQKKAKNLLTFNRRRIRAVLSKKVE